MSTDFCPSSSMSCSLVTRGQSPCLEYAAEETVRLFRRLGVTVERQPSASGDGYALTVAVAGKPGPRPAAALSDIRHDGYVMTLSADGAALAAPTPKGVLNAVYDLAERLGFLFLMPGDAGEWAPEQPRPVPEGECRVIPRFSHRGMFGGLNIWPFTRDQWLPFFAKLRFNAQSGSSDDSGLCEKLGIRLETGGHGMASLLPRELYKEKPELFRMFQPEDFSGKRLDDSNFCPTNPETARLVRDNFRRQIADLHGVHAVHAWADDLPAGGWCMCSRCRGLTASDQSQLAMNFQAAAIAQDHRPMRVPVIAYHDTLFPGRLVAPARECFLLYAPRERCYAHALDDRRCTRNRAFLRALQEWMALFEKHGDAHTFEYYNDQILFRGLYPFLPDVILRDMSAYEHAGIETHMSLQVGGAALAPDHNLLTFARAQWNPALTTAELIDDLARQLDPAHPAPWRRYLKGRCTAYATALAVCDVSNDIYFDYRFMPELAGEAGQTVARKQAEGAAALKAAADALERSAKGMSPRAAELAKREVARSRFEAEDLRAMGLHQEGLNRITGYLNSRDPAVLKEGLDFLEQTLAQLDRAAAAAAASGIPDKGGPYYHAFNRDWSQKEIREKIRIYRQALA